MPYRERDSGCGGIAAAILLVLILGLLVVVVGGLFFVRASSMQREVVMVAERQATLAAQEQAEAEAALKAAEAESQFENTPDQPIDAAETDEPFGDPTDDAPAQARTSPDEPREKWAIAVHGGAGSVPPEVLQKNETAYRSGLRKALETGKEILENGGTSLDAVEAAIRVLEDDPYFNAGIGAVFNSAGEHELDASIMDGKTLGGGGVAGVRTVKNPISLARRVMEQTKHVLLAGPGAETFATEQDVPRVENSEFSTDYQRQTWERVRKAEEDDGDGEDEERQEENPNAARLDSARGWQIGTVGCVALDIHGNIAAGTSTGGLTDKKFGRVGDSPLLGAGTYAENSTCGVSGTGIGEQFIRHAVAAQISLLMKHRDWTLEQSARYVFDSRLQQGDGGVIGVDRHGNITWVFTTPGMFRAAATASGRFEVKISDEP